MVDARSLDAIFAAALREEAAPWPAGWDTQEVLEAARRRLIYHGIAGLLLEREHLLEGWPPLLRAAARKETRARAIWELRHKSVISDVIEALHSGAVPTVLLKGTALAYSHYANAFWRFRSDSDLLIHEGDLVAARIILKRLGFYRPVATEGRFGNLHYEELWRYRYPGGHAHDIDLHWEVTNSKFLSCVFDTRDVLRESLPLVNLSKHARQCDPSTGLLLGCVNRAKHGHDGFHAIDRIECDPNRLIWAYDFHLQIGKFTKGSWFRLADKANEAGVGSIALDGLQFAQESIGTRVPSEIVEGLKEAPRSTPAVRFIYSKSNMYRNWADLSATRGLKNKLRFLLARLFPAPDHLRQKYPSQAHWPLIWLYLRRQLEALR